MVLLQLLPLRSKFWEEFILSVLSKENFRSAFWKGTASQIFKSALLPTAFTILSGSYQLLSPFENIAIYKIKANWIQFIFWPAFLTTVIRVLYLKNVDQWPAFLLEISPNVDPPRPEEECAILYNSSSLSSHLCWIPGLHQYQPSASGSDSRFLFHIKLQPTHLAGLAVKCFGMLYGHQLFFSWNRA